MFLHTTKKYQRKVDEQDDDEFTKTMADKIEQMTTVTWGDPAKSTSPCMRRRCRLTDSWSPRSEPDSFSAGSFCRINRSVHTDKAKSLEGFQWTSGLLMAIGAVASAWLVSGAYFLIISRKALFWLEQTTRCAGLTVDSKDKVVVRVVSSLKSFSRTGQLITNAFCLYVSRT